MLAVPWLRRLAFLLITAMLLIYAVLAWQLGPQIAAGRSDFLAAYTAGKILQSSSAHRLYDVQLQRNLQRGVTAVDRGEQVLPYVRPPFLAWVFWPLARLSYLPAFWTWTAINFAVLIVVIALLRQEVPPLQASSVGTLTIAAASFFPVFLDLLQGQDSILLLLIYVLAYRALRRGRYLPAGAILAIGVFKFPLVLPFIVPFIAHRRWRFVAGFAGVTACLLAVSTATVGWTAMMHYPAYLANIDKLAPGINIPRDMPNLRGLLAITFASSARSIPVTMILVAVSLAALAWTTQAWSADSANVARFRAGYALNLVTTILVSYHAHVFDLTVLVLAGCLAAESVVSGAVSGLGARRMLVWVLALVAFSPLYLILSGVCHCAALLVLPLLALFVALARVTMTTRQLTVAHGNAEPI